MANKKFILGMLAILLVFGFTLVGCEYGDPGLEGTWKNTTQYDYSSYISTYVNTFTFTAGEYELKTVYTTTPSSGNYTETLKGTYVASNGLLGTTRTSQVRTGSSPVSNNLTSTSTVEYVIYGNTLLYGNMVYTKE
jgi:hypothetical protein